MVTIIEEVIYGIDRLCPFSSQESPFCQPQIGRLPTFPRVEMPKKARAFQGDELRLVPIFDKSFYVDYLGTLLLDILAFWD